MDTIELPKETVICAARHFTAAFESSKQRSIVDFGRICANCECADSCRYDWMKTAAPLFEAAGIHPMVFKSTPFEPACIAGSPLLCRLWRRIHARKHTRKGG